MNNRFCLVSDDDGHYYIIPYDKKVDWSCYLEECEHYWGEQNYDGDPPEQPEWAETLGCSPTMVSFSDWKVETI